MADRTTGELDAVKESPISGLPEILELYDDTLIPVEQNGVAMYMTGKQWRGFGEKTAEIYVQVAVDASEVAKSSEQGAQEAENGAAASLDKLNDQVELAQEARDGAEKAKQAIENMTVGADTLQTGVAATVTKTTEDGVTHLQFGLPRGLTGEQGIPGVSPTVDVAKEGNTTTVTFTDVTGKHSATILDGEGQVNSVNGKTGEVIITAAEMFLAVHPVGSLYMSEGPTSPAELFGGTWEQIKDRFILAAGDTYAADSTGGAASVTSGGTAINVAQMPAHSHEVDGIQWPGPGDQPGWTGWGEGPNVRTTTTSKITGGGQPHTHTVATMPPYIVAYVWRRVA